MSTGGSYLGEAYPGGEPTSAASPAASGSGGLGTTYPGQGYPGGTPDAGTSGTGSGGAALGGVYFGQPYPGGTPAQTSAPIDSSPSTVVCAGVLTLGAAASSTTGAMATGLLALNEGVPLAAATASGALSLTGSGVPAPTRASAPSAAVTLLGVGLPATPASGAGQVVLAASAVSAARTTPSGVLALAGSGRPATSATATGSLDLAMTVVLLVTGANGFVELGLAVAPPVSAGTAALELAGTGHPLLASVLKIVLTEAWGSGQTQSGLPVAHLLGADAATVSLPGARSGDPARDRGYAVNPLMAPAMRSYERWLRFRLPAGSTTVHDLRVVAHTAGLKDGWEIRWGAAAAYATPTNEPSVVVTAALADLAELPLSPDPVTLGASPSETAWLVLQASVVSGTEHGPMEPYYYDYAVGRNYVTGVELEFGWLETVGDEDRPGRFSVWVNAALGVSIVPTSFVRVQSVAVASRITSTGHSTSLTGRPVGEPVQRQRIHYTTV